MSYNYSNSKCPKCERTAFETVHETPKDSNYVLQFIRCSSCKTVVGVLEYLNIGATIAELAKKLGKPIT
jgi:phage FluMu protein Com